MKFTAALACTALFASSVTAADPTFLEQRAQAIERRNARRTNKFHGSTINMTQLVSSSDNELSNSITKRSGNRPGGWGGAVVTGRQGVKNVKSTFVVPKPSKPATGNKGTKYGGAAWVGIDGVGTGQLFQTGVTWTVQNGKPNFQGWYEWVPGPYTVFPSLSFKPGDTVSVQVVANSPTSGTAYVTNESTGKSAQKALSGQPALAQQTAEWIVEDFQSGAEPAPFANFQPEVEFSSCSFTDAAGVHGVPANAIVVNVGQDQHNPFTSCSVVDSSTVTCSRTGAFS